MSATRDATDNILTLAAKNHEKYGTELSQRLLISATAAINERERLREALRAALNSLVRTVRKSYPNYPEEQMQISPTMTVADARVALSDQKG